MTTSSALLLIDLQNDFFPGGKLPISTAEELIPFINSWMVRFFDKDFPVIGTQFWYPQYHKKFAKNHRVKNYTMKNVNGVNQLLWPEHCIENSIGAQIHPDLLDIPTIVFKGLDSEYDNYSGFSNTIGNRNTGLLEILKSYDVDEIFIIGLLTDFGVKFTALDAVRLGFETTVILEACRGIDIPRGNIHKAIVQMIAAGVKVI